jgi:hypothetical protein
MDKMTKQLENIIGLQALVTTEVSTKTQECTSLQAVTVHSTDRTFMFSRETRLST